MNIRVKMWAKIWAEDLGEDFGGAGASLPGPIAEITKDVAQHQL